MSEEQPPQEQEREKKHWFSRLLKIVFFVAAFLLVIFTVMANMGGNSDIFKESIEELAGDLTGYDAKIRTFNNMGFFPAIEVDFEGLELFEKDSIADPVIYVDDVRVGFSFWDVMVSSGRVKTLYVGNLKALPGVILDKDIQMKELTFIEKEAGEPRLEGVGYIGTHPFHLAIDVEAEGSVRNRRYRFGGQHRVLLTVSDAAFEMRFSHEEGQSWIHLSGPGFTDDIPVEPNVDSVELFQDLALRLRTAIDAL